MPNTPKGGGISRKIFNPGERKKIRNILNEIVIPSDMGIIVRTAGSNKTKNEIDGDLKNLITVWNSIKENALNSIAPSLIHQESDIIKRSLRDYFDSSFDEILVNEKNTLKKSREIIKQFMPGSSKLINFYDDKKPLFAKFGLEKKIIGINNPVTRYPSLTS